MQSTMRFVLLVGLGNLLTISCANLAFAQNTASTTSKIKSPFQLKVGAFSPSDGNVRSVVGKSFTSFGLSYDFHTTPTTLPLIFSIYMNDAGKSKNIRLGTSTVKAEAGFTSAGLQVRTYLVPEANSLRFFVGGGLGYYAVRAKNGIREGNVVESVSKDSARIGGKIFGGAEWNRRYVAEIEGMFAGPVSVLGTTFDVSGISATLGLRF